MDKDLRTMSMLVEKGISGGSSAERTIHMLTYEGRDSWMAEELLQKRMWVDVNDYRARHACLENGAVDVAKLLLDQGMDLNQYKEWAKRQSHGLRCDDNLTLLEEHWAELQAQAQEQGQAQGEEPNPIAGGATTGGMTLG